MEVTGSVSSRISFRPLSICQTVGRLSKNNMGDWHSFYKRHSQIAAETAAGKKSTQEQELAKQWKTCVELSCAQGTRLENVRCSIDDQPQRAWLDVMSTAAHRLVVEYEPAWYDHPMGESGGPYYTLRVAKPGLWGLLDRYYDYSK